MLCTNWQRKKGTILLALLMCSTTPFFVFIMVQNYQDVYHPNYKTMHYDHGDITVEYRAKSSPCSSQTMRNYNFTDPGAKTISLLAPETKCAVPNIVHYTWLGENEMFNFYHFLSMKSVYMNIRPDVVRFHCDQRPIGHWWREMMGLIDVNSALGEGSYNWNFEIVHREAPTEIHGNEITIRHHKLEIAAMEILLNEGGIYLELDVIALKSFNPLRKFNFTMGLEYYGSPGRLNNGVIIARNDSQFLRLWYDRYYDFKKSEWDEHSARVPYEMMYTYPHLIHVEEKTINYPSGKELELIYERNYNWSSNYALHMWQELYDIVHGPKAIAGMHTTFGEIARWIYYGFI